MKFNLNSFIIFILLFITEILIAQTSGFIRHTFGDFLVVIAVYYLVASFFDISAKVIAISVLLFSYFIEILQYLNLVSLLGLSNNKLACIIIGNTFSIGDLFAYTFGIITVFVIERKFTIKKSKLKI
ncbi:conserved membrane protein of unknown function [Tenacibaculum soleae]|uniref:ribosomal maturation YjgA family protein n=1 Tax=Tenacibaculum soleae TaxID=447689 RepID=UPI003AB7FB4A